MGRKCNSKHLSLSKRRKSKKKAWIKRRKLQKLLLNEAQAENIKNAENVTNIEPSVTSVPDVNLQVETGILYCLSQVMTEEAANKEAEEIYQDESIYNENIEYYENEDNEDNKDNEDLITDNQCFLDTKEEVEVNEEQVEIYEEKEEVIYNENIEYYNDMETLIIDNNCVSDRINSIPKNIPKGRYIVDICYMWNEIHRTFDDHARGIECQFRYWQLVNFHRRGLLIQLFFKCQMCNYKTSIWTDSMHSEESDINAASAAGCIKAGIGYTQMKNLCTAMNIKYMAEQTYTKNRDTLLNKKTVSENVRTKLNFSN